MKIWTEPFPAVQAVQKCTRNTFSSSSVFPAVQAVQKRSAMAALSGFAFPAVQAVQKARGCHDR